MFSDISSAPISVDFFFFLACMHAHLHVSRFVCHLPVFSSHGLCTCGPQLEVFLRPPVQVSPSLPDVDGIALQYARCRLWQL